MQNARAHNKNRKTRHIDHYLLLLLLWYYDSCCQQSTAQFEERDADQLYHDHHRRCLSTTGTNEAKPSRLACPNFVPYPRPVWLGAPVCVCLRCSRPGSLPESPAPPCTASHPIPSLFRPGGEQTAEKQLTATPSIGDVGDGRPPFFLLCLLPLLHTPACETN